MTFIPQALADPASRSVLLVWHDEENFRRYWADKVKTIDAPGMPTHPRLIKVGDVIDWFVTGWNRATVKAVKFTPDASDIPDYHRSGCYTFETDGGFFSIRVDGRKVIDVPMYVFPANIRHEAQPPPAKNKSTAGRTAKAVGPGPLVSCFSGGASELVFWSFRYFIGRMTIATCCFADDLARAWPLLDERTQNLIREELDEAFAKDDEMRADPARSSHYYPLGMDCDRTHWEKVRAAHLANNGGGATP